ncbi:MAG: deoxynucleoside kinase [Acidobacteria bacterium]|nr:deoxynucleoside kinase [Acidobacteriota bacterium]MCB9399499.1 deoxynucleoside kinase [Acidobacteriota bacterium]
MTLPYRHIAFEGPMCSGTTQLARQMAPALGGEAVFDVGDNPFLSQFYREKPGSAFKTQLFFLLNRHQVLSELNQPSLFHQVIISDFILEKDRIYAYQNLSDSELMIYEKLYGLLCQEMVKPDLVVYLQMAPDKVIDLVRKRRGTGLYTIADEYIDSVVEGYNRFFFHYTETPLIIVNANDVQFDRDKVAFNDLLQFLKRSHRGVTYFTPQIGEP